MLQICHSCLSPVTGEFCANCGSRLGESSQPLFILRVGWSKSRDYESVVTALSAEEGYVFREEGEDIYHEIPVFGLEHLKNLINRYDRALKWRDTCFYPPSRPDVCLSFARGPGGCFAESLISGDFPCNSKGGCIHASGIFAPDPDPGDVARLQHLVSLDHLWAMEAFLWQVLEMPDVMACPMFRARVSVLSREIEGGSQSRELWPFAASVVQDRKSGSLPFIGEIPRGSVTGWRPWAPSSELLHAYWGTGAGDHDVWMAHDGLHVDSDTGHVPLGHLLDAVRTRMGTVVLMDSGEEGIILVTAPDFNVYSLPCRSMAVSARWESFACISGDVLKIGSLVYERGRVVLHVHQQYSLGWNSCSIVDFDGRVLIISTPDGCISVSAEDGVMQDLPDGVAAVTSAGLWRTEEEGWMITAPDGRSYRLLGPVSKVIPAGTRDGIILTMRHRVILMNDGGRIDCSCESDTSEVQVTPWSMAWQSGGLLAGLRLERPVIPWGAVDSVMWLDSGVPLSEEDINLLAEIAEFCMKGDEEPQQRLRRLVDEAPPAVRDELLRLISAVPVLDSALHGSGWQLVASCLE